MTLSFDRHLLAPWAGTRVSGSGASRGVVWLERVAELFPRAATPAAFAALAHEYRALDAALAELAVAPCRGCGMCCRFDEVEHTLFATGLETAYWLVAAGPPGSAPATAERCPYQDGDHCRARGGRMLGCRLYACAWPSDEMSATSEVWHGRLKALHDGLGLTWDYAPLLTRTDLPWRRDADDSGGLTTESAVP